MPFPPSFLDDVVARNPIEDVVGQYVTMQRRGSNLFGLCPFHGGEDRLLFRCAGEGHLLLLWLPQRGRSDQFHHGN